MIQTMKPYLLKLVEGFLKEEYNLEWVDIDIKINDATGKIENIGHLYHDEKTEKCWEACE